MPENLLLTGPAGGGKSQAARELLRTGKVDVAADFQSILAALLLLERDPETGRYPPRDRAAERLIPLAQAIKALRSLAEARSRELTVVATNSPTAVSSPTPEAHSGARRGLGAHHRPWARGGETKTCRSSHGPAEYPVRAGNREIL